jgi:RNA polymerase sigma-70 factor (ECF subfamily)
MTFEAAFERYRPEVFRYAYAMSKDIDRSDDLVQTAMMRTFHNWDKVKNETPKGYMMKACKNAWIDVLRSPECRHTIQMDESFSFVSGEGIENELAERLEAQRRLSHADKAVQKALPLLAEGSTYDEAAEAVGLTRQALKSRIFRTIAHKGHGKGSLKILGSNGKHFK